MRNLIASAVFFGLLHRVISGSSLRHVLVQRMGERAYARLFKLASVVGLAWMCLAYGGTASEGSASPLWSVPTAVLWLQLVLQPVAILLVVAGITTPNPGTFGQEKVASAPEPVHGMLRVTRHPFLWGIGLFAVGHLLVSPTPRSLVLFGTLAFVALTGTFSIDAKRRRSLGEKWAAFEARTSNLPFMAVVRGRQRIRLREIGWWRPAIAIALAIALTSGHELLFCASGLPS